jgi:hypothetical protein
MIACTFAGSFDPVRMRPQAEASRARSNASRGRAIVFFVALVRMGGSSSFFGAGFFGLWWGAAGQAVEAFGKLEDGGGELLELWFDSEEQDISEASGNSDPFEELKDLVHDVSPDKRLLIGKGCATSGTSCAV